MAILYGEYNSLEHKNKTTAYISIPWTAGHLQVPPFVLFSLPSVNGRHLAFKKPCFQLIFKRLIVGSRVTALL